MRNHSSVRPRLRLAVILCAAFAAFALFAPALHAQCSDDNSGDSLGCPAEVPLPGATQPGESPAVLTLQQQPRQGAPKADHSNEASATNSLTSGATYTEASAGIGNRGPGGATFAPEPPTEFQRFVAASTGQMLPVYGASFFSSEPASFGPIDHGPAPEQLIVGAGDELRIRIWGQVNFSANLRVSREGEIFLPKVGAVHVAGMPFATIAPHLTNAMNRVYRNFELSVDMGEIHSIQIYVTGMAHRPGEYTVSALSTLVDAVFASAGPSSAGSMRHVQLRRDGKVITDFDLYTLLIKGDKTGDVQLQPGDVLFIPTVGPQVALLGSVRLAGIYELRGEESIDQLLEEAGGRTAIASGARLSVERIEEHARRQAFDLAADAAGLATILADGDIVRIDPILSKYRETVTLRGSVANPGRFRWHEGMHLSELMPDRDSLVTRNYWWRRTELGLPAPQLADSVNDPSNSLHSIRKNGSVQTETEKPAAVSSPGSQTDWNYAVIERLDSSTMATSLVPFDLGKLVLDHDSSQDLELKPGDVVTIFSQDDIRLPISQQTKYVHMEGEFVHAGVYSVAPGETLRSLIARAGGFTEKAYLYGSEFTRKSTQALEQERIDEYTARLEHQLERNSLSAAGVVGQQNSAGQQANAINRDLIARLRRVRASGRIVLGLSPRSKEESDIPDISLEDGDRLVVPSAPSTVQVVGAVLNQNAFLYRAGARLDNYLRLAGGTSREADRGRMFILRADGTVNARDAAQSVFASGFENLRLYPGDTIVVPEKNVRPSAMNQLIAWTQLLSQFSLSALEVNLLK